MEYGNFGDEFRKFFTYLLRAFYKLKVEGKEHIRNLEKKLDEKMKIIIATTHASILRSIAIGLALNRKFMMIVHEEWKKGKKKVVEPFLRLLNTIWIPGNKNYCRNSLEKAIEALTSCYTPRFLIIAPQGNYNADKPSAIEFRPGFAFMAVKAQKRNKNEIWIVPTIEYTKGLLFREYHVRFLNPVKVSVDEDYRELSKKVEGIVKEEMGKILKI